MSQLVEAAKSRVEILTDRCGSSQSIVRPSVECGAVVATERVSLERNLEEDTVARPLHHHLVPLTHSDRDRPPHRAPLLSLRLFV